jgi:lactoylglutathione lyase
VSERPFRVLGLQQIAVGGLDKGKLRELWVELLGLEAHGNLPWPAPGPSRWKWT